MSSNRDEYIGLSNVKYIKPVLEGEIDKFEIPKYEEIFTPAMRHHPFYKHHDEIFEKELFLYSNLPVHIGGFSIKWNKNHITNVLRCPIKNSGNRSIYLPKELGFLKDFVTYCCNYENTFNEQFNDLFAHITVHCDDVKEGKSQRVPGWHVDGFQGAKFPQKHKIEHSYLWSSSSGTEFCVQPFMISHIDDSKYMIFDEFTKQAKEENLWKMLDSNIYIIDPYMVHRSPILSKNTTRLLVRLTFEYQKLLDPNDTQNPKLTFKIPYKYDIRNRLGTFPVELIPEMYGYKRMPASTEIQTSLNQN